MTPWFIGQRPTTGPHRPGLPFISIRHHRLRTCLALYVTLTFLLSRLGGIKGASSQLAQAPEASKAGGLAPEAGPRAVEGQYAGSPFGTPRRLLSWGCGRCPSSPASARPRPARSPQARSPGRPATPAATSEPSLPAPPLPSGSWDRSVPPAPRRPLNVSVPPRPQPLRSPGAPPPPGALGLVLSSPNSLPPRQDAPRSLFWDPSRSARPGSARPHLHPEPLSGPSGPPSSPQTPIPLSPSRRRHNAHRTRLGLVPPNAPRRQAALNPAGAPSGRPAGPRPPAGPTCAPSWFSCCMSPPTASGTGPCVQCRRPMASSRPAASQLPPPPPPASSSPAASSPRFRSRTFATAPAASLRPRGAADTRELRGVGRGAPADTRRPRGRGAWVAAAPVDVPEEPAVRQGIPYRLSRWGTTPPPGAAWPCRTPVSLSLK